MRSKKDGKGGYFIPDSKNSAVIGQAGGVGTEAVNQFFLFFFGERGEIPPDFGQRLNLLGCRATYIGQGEFLGPPATYDEKRRIWVEILYGRAKYEKKHYRKKVAIDMTLSARSNIPRKPGVRKGDPSLARKAGEPLKITASIREGKSHSSKVPFLPSQTGVGRFNRPSSRHTKMAVIIRNYGYF